MDKIRGLLEAAFLPGVSRQVRAAFTRSLHAWRGAQHADVSDAAHFRHFAALAALLTNRKATLPALASRRIRELDLAMS